MAYGQGRRDYPRSSRDAGGLGHLGVSRPPAGGFGSHGAVEKLLGKSIVRHSDNMTGPSCLRLEEEGLDADLPGALKDLSIRDLLLPFDAEKATKAGQMEVVQLSGMAGIHCPGLTAIKKGSKDNCIIHLELCFQAETSALPHTFPESPERGTGFSYSAVDLNVNICFL